MKKSVKIILFAIVTVTAVLGLVETRLWRQRNEHMACDSRCEQLLVVYF